MSPFGPTSPMPPSLDQLAHGRRARVTSVSQSTCTVTLMELGLVPGAEVRVVRSAPLGDPLEVDVTGARLALRRDVAALVQVEELE